MPKTPAPRGVIQSEWWAGFNLTPGWWLTGVSQEEMRAMIVEAFGANAVEGFPGPEPNTADLPLGTAALVRRHARRFPRQPGPRGPPGCSAIRQLCARERTTRGALRSTCHRNRLRFRTEPRWGDKLHRMFTFSDLRLLLAFCCAVGVLSVGWAVIARTAAHIRRQLAPLRHTSTLLWLAPRLLR